MTKPSEVDNGANGTDRRHHLFEEVIGGEVSTGQRILDPSAHRAFQGVLQSTPSKPVASGIHIFTYPNHRCSSFEDLPS